MEVVLRDASGLLARIVTKEQFDVIHNRLVDAMNGDKSFNDAEAVAMLEQAGQPIDFLMSILLNEALYAEAPIVGFLGAWLGTDVARGNEVYCAVREYLDFREHNVFDMQLDEVEQRTFMYLVAYVEGARPAERL